MKFSLVVRIWMEDYGNLGEYGDGKISEQSN